VGPRPDQLLGDVGALDQERDLLGQPLGGDRAGGQRLGQAIAQPRRDGRRGGGGVGGELGEQRAQRVDPGREIDGQHLALAIAVGAQLIERGGQGLADRRRGGSASIAWVAITPGTRSTSARCGGGSASSRASSASSV
jgi:hypothetical protein